MRRRSERRTCKPSSRRRAKHWSRRRRWPSSADRRHVAANKRRRIAAAARVAAQLAPGVMVVDIGIAQRLLQNAGPGLASVDRQNAAARARRSKLSPVTSSALSQPDAETDLERLTDSFHLNLHGLRPAVVFRRTVHRQFGDRPRLRTAAADAANLAGLRRFRPPAQHGAGDRTGFAGARRRADRIGLRLSDRRGAAARCRRVACAGFMARRFPGS